MARALSSEDQQYGRLTSLIGIDDGQNGSHGGGPAKPANNE